MTKHLIDGKSLPILDHLRHAGSPSARAEIVLRMPLAMMIHHYGQIYEILSEYGDDVTRRYLALETAALLSVRDVTGSIPAEKNAISARVTLVQTYQEAPCQSL